MSNFLLAAVSGSACLMLIWWALDHSGVEPPTGWRYAAVFYVVLVVHIAFFFWCCIKKKLKAVVLLWWAGFTVYPICLMIWNQPSWERPRLLRDLCNREEEYRGAMEASPPPRSASADLFVSKRRMEYRIAKAKWDHSDTQSKIRYREQQSRTETMIMPATIAGISLILFLLTWRFFKTEDVLEER